MRKSSRQARSGIIEARTRLRTAEAYLEVSKLVLDEQAPEEFLSVSTGLAVLAGIAASDSICCARVGARYRGDDHRGAARLLGQATPDGKTLATVLRRLLDLKDEAHYGVMAMAPRRARDAVRWAGRSPNAHEKRLSARR